MPFINNVNETKEAAPMQYACKVVKAKIIDEKKINFMMNVNGVTIFGMNLIEYKNSEGKPGKMISFPQWKGKEKYNDYVSFPISRELKEDIIKQIYTMLNIKDA